MIRAAPFSVDLWRDIVLQPQQRRDHVDAMAVFEGPSWTFVDGQGHCLACGGIYPVADDVAVAWAYIGADSGPHFSSLFLKARKIIRDNRHRWPVVRSGCLADFAAGNRLLRLLGFKSLGLEVTHEARVYSVFELAGRGHS